MTQVKSPELPLQAAIKILLETALGTSIPVSEDVPARTAKPYVVIGQNTSCVPYMTADKGGEIVRHQIDIWTDELTSGYRGSKQAREIMKIIKGVLTQTPANLSADGFESVEGVLEIDNVQTDPDGITRHGILRLAYYILEL